MGSHSFCANLTHFEVGSHSSEAADLDRSAVFQQCRITSSPHEYKCGMQSVVVYLNQLAL